MNLVLEFACTGEALARLEAAVSAAADAPAHQRLAALLPLAWQLRERDTARALALADQAQDCLAASALAELAGLADLAGLAELAGLAGLADPEALGMAARLTLIRGEAKFLLGELDDSAALAAQAMRGFVVCQDAIGCADVHWLQTIIAGGQGDATRRDAELAAAIAAPHHDLVRRTIAEATLANMAALRDVVSAKQSWGAHFARVSVNLHPAASAWVEGFFAVAAALSSEHVAAIRHDGTCYTLALATGQSRRAIFAAIHLGDAFNMLNDHHAALEWMQRGLDLARPRAWPISIGVALRQTAETLRLAQRPEAARELLCEAMTLMAPLASSHDYAIALGYLGDVDLDLQHYNGALASFVLLEQRANALGGAALLFSALRGQARALLQLGQPQDALTQAHAALAAAKVHANYQIDALRVLADIHARYPLLPPLLPPPPPPTLMRAASAALHYLQQAQEVAATIIGFTLPGELLEALADEYAKSGDSAKAYQLAKQAIAAHAKIHSSQATNRASAIQVSHETQKAWADGEHHRKLAAAHAERADALEQANRTLAQANSTLKQLGAVGRDITANLETHAIFSALDTHVHALLDVTTFEIYQLEADASVLRMVFGVEAGQASPPDVFSLHDPVRPAARCARERSELVIDFAPGSDGTIPGTLDTLSVMFAPLLAGEHLLGVMTVQTVRPHAYHAREAAIFRTLCAWAAIALANTESQAQMVQREKMASLGQLVANVAHEINTPIGAVKSSGASIAQALNDVLDSIPRLYKMLDDPQQALFQQLIGNAREPGHVLTSREERSLIRQTSGQLQAQGVADARHQAGVLVQLRAHAHLNRYLPLLLHPHSAFILGTAASVANIIHSSANINTAVASVAKIVFALRAFTRVDHNAEMIETSLRDSLDTVLTIYHSQIKNDTVLVQNYQDIPPLRCLPDELNQVWTNLINNALHAMQYRGTLTLGIRQEGGEAVVSVGDSGGGIPENIRNRIFDPFFTTKPTGEGSGLGLDIAKKIVAKHKGRIDVQSEAGVGTVFSVYLPYA